MLLLVWDEPLRIFSSRVNFVSCLFFRPLTSGLTIPNTPCAERNCHFESFLTYSVSSTVSLFGMVPPGFLHIGSILCIVFIGLGLLILGCPIRPFNSAELRSRLFPPFSSILFFGDGLGFWMESGLAYLAAFGYLLHTVSVTDLFSTFVLSHNTKRGNVYT